MLGCCIYPAKEFNAKRGIASDTPTINEHD